MKKTAVLLAAIFALAVLANASLIPTLSSETAMGGDWAFNYSTSVTLDERLDPSATNGVTCPGPGNTLVQCNPQGTFFTVYDIPGFVSAAVTTPGWTVSEQLTGITPSTINGAAFDSASLMNVTYMYTGPVVSGPSTFTGFQIVSSDSSVNVTGHFTSQATNNVGGAAGTTDQVSGSVAIPAAPATTTPEPDSLVFMGVGAAGILLGLRRRARK
jgi:hypothetical protein